jgi:hypothetical protein
MDLVMLSPLPLPWRFCILNKKVDRARFLNIYLNMAAKALSLNLTCYYNKVTILQYGGLARYLNYYLKFIRFVKWR